MRLIVALGLSLLLVGVPARAPGADFTALVYHDVVDDARALTNDATTLRNLTIQFDWLRENGYHVVSVDDLVAAQRGERPLPPRPVLLTFDDGYRTFYTHVYPLLLAYRYPAVLSVVGSFLDAPPRAQVRFGSGMVNREDFVSWAELREMQRSGLVEIGSHTYGLHTTIFANPQGGEVPATVGHEFLRQQQGPQIADRYPLELPQPRFGDTRSILRMPSSPYLALAIEVAQAAIDYAYDPRTGRYETEAEYRRRIQADLARNSDLLEGQLGKRPRVVSWPYGRWSEVTLEAARAAGMPIGLTMDPERADVRELGRVGRFYAANNPDLRFVSASLVEPPRPALLRGLCVSLDEVYAPTEDEQETRLGRVLDRVRAFQPNTILLAAGSSAPGGGVYFPNDRLPVRADLFSRAAWQLFTRTGAAVAAWLPVAQAGPDPETATAVYGALARAVPFRTVTLGPAFLAGDLAPGTATPGLSRWDPRTPRRLREAQDRTRLSERGRLGLSLFDAVLRHQPAVKLLDVVDLPQIRPPAEVAVDAVDRLAVRWDGAPDEALRKLRDQGWLAGDHWGRLVYWSSRAVPADWRHVQRAGLVNSVYCPDRLLDRPAELAAMSAVVGASTYPFRP